MWLIIIIGVVVLMLVLAIVKLSTLLQTSKMKGILLETAIDIVLSKYMGYNAVGNIYLQKENGEYTEIDHVFIHKTGLFVIETKNYSGWIFGDENNAKWTQTFPNGRKIQFFNPIKQNNIHIKALKHALKEYSHVPMYSIVAFGKKCVLKDIAVSSENVKVIQVDQLESTINTIIENSTVDIPKEDRDGIYKLLNLSTKEKRELRKVHIGHIEANQNKCPFCKSDLVKRENKKTNKTFYGCSGYPKCKYTAI